MALCPNQLFPDIEDPNLFLKRFLQGLNELSFEMKTKSNKEDAVGTTSETSSGSPPEEQGDGPLPSEGSISAPELLLNSLGREEPPRDSDGPAGPLPRGPALVTSERQPRAEAVPPGDTGEPAAPPDGPGAHTNEVEVKNPATDQAKPKSKRSFRFSPYQRDTLTESFKANRNLPAREMKALAAQLELSPLQVQNWFRNERRKYNLWFAHLLDEEHGTDPDTLLAMTTEVMSLRTGVGSMAHRLRKK